MMRIKTASRQFTWHVGEPLPHFDHADYPGITFYADGHELAYMIAVLEGYARVSYQIGVEGWGVPVVRRIEE